MRFCETAGDAFDAHGASGLASVARSLATAAVADGLVEEWRPSTPLLVIAALRFLAQQGMPDPATAELQAVLTAAQAQLDAVRAFVRDRPVQFTEPLRASLVLAGLLIVARESERPLRLIEIGAGAGLLLAFDRYRHVFATGAWGPEDASLTLRSPLDVPPELLATELHVVDRIGIDLDPVDVRDPAGVALLRAFAWTGTREREQRLEHACRIVAEDPPRLLKGDAIELLPDVLAGSATDVTTVVFECGTVNQLDPLQRLRLMGRLAAAGERVPSVLLSRPGGDPGPMSCRFVLSEAPRRRTPRTYAHADILGEQARWHGPIDRAFDMLSESLGPAGQWPITVRPIGAGAEREQAEITPCITAHGMLALARSDDPRAAALRQRSARHLEDTVQGPSLWRYYRDTPPDTDDTSLAALALGREHRLIRDVPAAEALIANRTSEGKFRTWMHWPPDQRADNDTGPMLDATVNAHVIGLLGERAETKAAIDWVSECVMSGTEAANSWYYRRPLTLYLALQRAVDGGVSSLASAAQTAVARAQNLLRERRDGEAHWLACAVLVATWRRQELDATTSDWARSELLGAQRADGGWPPGVIYVGVAPPGEPTVEFRSAALTTALCVSALLGLESASHSHPESLAGPDGGRI